MFEDSIQRNENTADFQPALYGMRTSVDSDLKTSGFLYVSLFTSWKMPPSPGGSSIHELARQPRSAERPFSKCGRPRNAHSFGHDLKRECVV